MKRKQSITSSSSPNKKIKLYFQIPDDIWILIFQYLEFHFVHLASVSNQFWRVLQYPASWKYLTIYLHYDTHLCLLQHRPVQNLQARAEILCKALSNFTWPFLTHVLVTSLDSETGQEFIKSLVKCKTISQVTFSMSVFDDATFDYLAQDDQFAKQIEGLHFQFCCVSQHMMKQIAKILGNAPKLKRLTFAGANIDNYCEPFTLCLLPQLTHLYLNNAAIDDALLQKLATHFAKLTHLQVLNVSNNTITNTQGIALFPKSIIDLDLSLNPVCKTVSALCQQLEQALPKLERLNIVTSEELLWVHPLQNYLLKQAKLKQLYCTVNGSEQIVQACSNKHIILHDKYVNV